MSQRLDEQIMTIERALGERMIEHAVVVVRSWLNELGENNPYEEALRRIQASYNELFDEWLSIGNEDTDIRLNRLTGEMYQLVDAAYASIRIKRGMSPEMHGFDRTSIPSIINYFTACVHIQEEDFDWLYEAANDRNQATEAFVAVAALSANLRETFNEQAMLTMIDIVDAENNIVADQALASLILLFAQWDVRVDFFPQMQEAFAEKIGNGEGERAFLTMEALIRTANRSIKDIVNSEHITKDDLPEELINLVSKDNNDEDEPVEQMLSRLVKLMPKNEEDYITAIIDMMPETWIFDLLVGEDERRNETVEKIYLSIGYMDFMWDRLEEAENWLIDRLRSGKATAKDYINYAHCCFLKGDRMMAYENYLEAKRMCKGAREFFDLFRPDRKTLVEKGIPLEQVYLMEDQLLRADN